MAKHILKIVLGFWCIVAPFSYAAGSEYAKRKQKTYNQEITPNLFKGTDSERIQQAIHAAKRNNKPVQDSPAECKWNLDLVVGLCHPVTRGYDCFAG